MSKLEKLINSYKDDDLIYASVLLKDFPAFYRDIKKCNVIKIKKGIYVKNVTKKNIITNSYINIYENENMQNKLLLTKYKEELVATDITLLNKLNLTLQTPSIKTYIVINNIKINNIKGYKLVYNRKEQPKEILLIDSFLKAIYTDIELNNNNFLNYLINNKKLFDNYIKNTKQKSNKYYYTLYVIYNEIYKDKQKAKQIKKCLNISSKFELPQIIKNNYMKSSK